MFKPLLDEDFSAAAELLAEGFPQRGRDGWEQGLQSLRRHARNADVGVPLGLLMMDRGQPVGVALMPASRRYRPDGQPYTLVNLSSWYVKPAQRWRAGLMLRAMVADNTRVYIDLTPTEEVQRMLPLFGFKPVNQGTTVALLPLVALGSSSGARLRALCETDTLPAGAPPRDMLLAHRELQCVSLMLEHPQGQALLVYRPRPLRGVPGARLKYIGSHALMVQHLPLLARHLLSRGMSVLSWDTRETTPPGLALIQRQGGLWYARGENFADCTDFVGTELCILGV
jgi:hypothetical protein